MGCYQTIFEEAEFWPTWQPVISNRKAIKLYRFVVLLPDVGLIHAAGLALEFSLLASLAFQKLCETSWTKRDPKQLVQISEAQHAQPLRNDIRGLATKNTLSSEFLRLHDRAVHLGDNPATEK